MTETNKLRLPWHRETVGHASVGQIARQVALDLSSPPAEGIPPNTDATWIINADDKIVAFVGNGPRQTDNADAIIEAVAQIDIYKQALATAIATVCRCPIPRGAPAGAPHVDACPVWQHGFIAARELLGIER